MDNDSLKRRISSFIKRRGSLLFITLILIFLLLNMVLFWGEREMVTNGVESMEQILPHVKQSLSIGYSEVNERNETIEVLGKYYWMECEYNYVKLTTNEKKEHYYIGGLEIGKQMSQSQTIHRKIPLVVPEKAIFDQNMVYFMDLWERISKKYDIVYTIAAGMLLGYCRKRKPLFWDDDFDVFTFTNHEVIEELYLSGESLPNRKETKKVEVFTNETIEIHKYSFEENAYVIHANLPHIPFMDVFPYDFFLKYIPDEVFERAKEGLVTWDDFPMIDVCGVPFRFPKDVDTDDSVCDNWMDSSVRYKGWRINARPPYDKKHIQIDSKFD